MKKNTGFTLLELLITVALVTIVMAIGIPSMRDFVKNDRLSTQINTLVGHLAYARSEAVLRHVPVIICASSTLTSCNSTFLSTTTRTGTSPPVRTCCASINPCRAVTRWSVLLAAWSLTTNVVLHPIRQAVFPCVMTVVPPT